MNTEIKKWLVDALESGEYNQGTTGLRNMKNGFCCLGVLCDLHLKTTDSGAWGINPLNDNWYRYYSDKADQKNMNDSSDQSTVVLPEAVRKWAGLASNDPEVVFEGNETSLSRLNDNGSSFQEIANIIKTQL
jgi:hypothetical protein